MGLPSLVSDSYNGQLVETEDSYIYTLSVPNTKDSGNVNLIITKTVAGNMGNKTKKFKFTFKLDDNQTNGVDPATAEFDWILNGVLQTKKIKNNGTFMLGHDDEAVISLPPGTKVTVSEDSDGYKPSFKLDESEPVDDSSLTFDVNKDAKLGVTNTYEALVPTGVWMSVGGLLVLLGAILAGLGWFIRRSRRLHRAMNE